MGFWGLIVFDLRSIILTDTSKQTLLLQEDDHMLLIG